MLAFGNKFTIYLIGGISDIEKIRRILEMQLRKRAARYIGNLRENASIRKKIYDISYRRNLQHRENPKDFGDAATINVSTLDKEDTNEEN